VATLSGKEEMRLETSNAVFTAVDIDPKGNYLAAGGQDGKVYLWQLPSGQLLQTFQATASISSPPLLSAPMARHWLLAAASRSSPFGMSLRAPRR